MNTQSISDIIRGMQHAVNTAEDMLLKHQIEKISSAFTKEGEPLMRYILLPDGRRVDIPLACLTPSESLSISEIELSFSVKVDDTVTKGDGKDERSSYSVSFSGTERKSIWGKKKKSAGVINIRMKFKERDEPEAAARVREMLDSTVK